MSPRPPNICPDPSNKPTPNPPPPKDSRCVFCGVSWHGGTSTCRNRKSIGITGIESMETEPRGQTATLGQKYDQEKLRYDLLPLYAVELMTDVLTYGAKKYEPDNWRKVDGWRWRYFGAACRHLFAWYRGERTDPESGKHHLGHALCCLAFLAELDLQTSQRDVERAP